MGEPTVFPEPFQPTMRVRGVLKVIDSACLGPKERILVRLLVC